MVDPNVPVSVGVRVLELTSALFPEGTAEIQPDHARQLDRAVAEDDLLNVDDDEASLALNRRSELIIYGLFVPATTPPSTVAGTTTIG